MIDYARHCVARGIISRERLVVDLDDWESATRRSMAEMYRRRGRKREARRVAWEAWRLERIERALAREAGRVWVAAPEDAHGLARRLAGVRVGVMPNGIPTLPPAAPAAGEDRTALFVGTFGYFPNQDAAQFFAEEVLPRLRRRDPRWRFIVVGRAAPPEFAQQIAAGAGVEFLGAADDLAPIYRRAAMIVAPVRGGGGTKVKVIEGLATGRPVIATAHAARGLGLRAGETFLCAEAAEEWVAACERVAGDPSLAARVGAAGRAWVAEHFVHRRAGEAPAGPGVPPQS